MSEPRFPGRDLRLEQLGPRDGFRAAPLGEMAHVAGQNQETSTWDLSAAYQALIDAVFSAPGAAEWLFGLRLKVATMVAGKNATPRDAVASDAIRAADPRRD